MKWIGIIKDKIEEDSSFVTRKAIIVKEPNGTYSVSLKVVYEDGSMGHDECVGQWAASLGAAKRRLMQDTDWKSSDFEWKVMSE